MLLEARHELDQVARPEAVIELVDEDALPGIAAGARRPGHGEEIGAAGNAAGRPALDRRGADLLIAQHAEDLAEAGALLIVDRVASLRRYLAPADARNAWCDHYD